MNSIDTTKQHKNKHTHILSKKQNKHSITQNTFAQGQTSSKYSVRDRRGFENFKYRSPERKKKQLNFLFFSILN